MEDKSCVSLWPFTFTLIQMNCKLQVLRSTGYTAGARSLVGLAAGHSHGAGKFYWRRGTERSRKRASWDGGSKKAPYWGGTGCSLFRKPAGETGAQGVGDTAADVGLGGWTHLQQGREPWSLGWTWSSWQNAGTSLPALARVKAATTQTWAT